MTQAGNESSRDQARDIEVGAGDLPLHCPLPGSPLWARHPRVFLDVTKTGHAACPYCGTRYVLQGGPLPGAH